MCSWRTRRCGNRTITLPLVTEPGLDTCMITVLCTQDSGQYNYLKVGDNGGTELLARHIQK